VRRAIFAGTFDPVHFGHLDVLKQALNTFDSVVWAIGNNPEKRTRFALPDRLEMMERLLLPVKVVAFDGLLVDAAKEYDCTHIVRSLRMGLDFDYEYPMTLINRHLNHRLTTVYFPASQEFFHINSSAVRQLHAMGEDLTKYVPAIALEVIVKIGREL